MAVHRTHHRFARLGAETLDVLRRLGNPTDNFTHGGTTVETIDPCRTSSVRCPFEHMTINLIYDKTRVRRARRLSRGKRRDEGKRADEQSHSRHLTTSWAR